ncbi:hypothetical protein ACH50_18710 [Franconibacter pulveris]|uniref:Uncharacterized protein n=1 Tax=Franconibacter pulveris TaxID=435910 RepID=A0A0J8VJE5_9ENTR|nr:hypothetical protein ACH50_18710 [Franconibacter pulveris]
MRVAKSWWEGKGKSLEAITCVAARLGRIFAPARLKNFTAQKKRKSLRKPQVRRTVKMRLQAVSKLGFILRKIGYYLIQKDSLFWVVRRKKAEQNISPPAK